MKKISIICLFLAFSYFSFGQQYNIVAGLDGGINLSSVVNLGVGVQYENRVLLPCLSAGPYLIYNANDKVSIKTAFYYSPERLIRNIYPDISPFASIRFYAPDFMIPILGRYNFDKKRLAFFLEAGPCVNIEPGFQKNYKLSSNSGLTLSNETRLTEHSIGLCIGAGICYQWKYNISFNLEGIYFAELNSIEGIDIYNFTHLTFGIGYGLEKAKSKN